jgi:hypothetical protein
LSFVVVLFVLAGLALLGWVLPPRYQGVTIGEWFRTATADHRMIPDCASAFRHFDRRGIRFLVGRLVQQPPAWERWYTQVRAQLSARLGVPPYVPPNRTAAVTCARKLLGYYESEAAGALLAASAGRAPHDRAVIIQALGELGPQAGLQVGPHLRRCLTDTSVEVVYEAITSLGMVEGNAVTPTAVLPFLQHRTDRVRVEASYTIGSCPPLPERTLGPLIAALQDPSPVVRANAARALGQIGGAAAEAVDSLQRRMVQDQSQALVLPAVRAAEALVLIVGREPPENLAAFRGALEAAEDGHDDYVRLMALQTRRRLGEPVPGLIGTCRRLLDAANNWPCWEAVECLAELNLASPEVRQALERATRHPNGLVRAKAKSALAGRSAGTASAVAGGGEATTRPTPGAAAERH